MQLLRTLLIIVIAYYLIKFVMRYVAPYLLRYFMHKAQKQSFGNTQTQNNGGHTNPAGGSRHKNNKESLGEYVDYEEITDEKSNKHHHE